MNFSDILISIYREHPCEALPNALWKTLAELERGNLQTEVAQTDGAVTHLALWEAQRLLVYWNRDRACVDRLLHYLAGARLALVHQDFMHAVPTERFAGRQPYFRLIHRMEPGAQLAPPPGFYIAPVDAPRDIPAVAELIGRCYAHLHPSADVVYGWTAHPVFDPDLWLWIFDAQTGLPAGLGIAELDPTIGEGSLEWVQVLPAYRGRGLGTALVNALLARLQGRAVFTTVAGEARAPSQNARSVNGRSNPEALYRRCGFTGNDLWWVMTSS
jgi:GNAT superfamily N-acetyltransferase